MYVKLLYSLAVAYLKTNTGIFSTYNFTKKTLELSLKCLRTCALTSVIRTLMC